MRGIIAFLMFAGAVVTLTLGARPIWQDIRVLTAEKDEFGSAIARINELRQIRNDLIQTYNSLPQEDIKRVKKILPDTFSSGLILVELSNLASESGLLLKSTDVSTGSRIGAPVVKNAGDRFTEVQLKLVVSGPYDRFRTFLQKLEKSLRLVDVTALSFTSASRADSSVDFSIEAKSYQQP